jgi:hypothetical protein
VRQPPGAFGWNRERREIRERLQERNSGKIQFDLIKLLNGERILRLTEPQSGLALEKKLAPSDAVVRQKEKLLSAFQAALARVELSAA